MSLEQTEKERLLHELQVKQRALEKIKGNTLQRFPWNAAQWEYLNDTRREVLLSGMNQGGKSTVLCGEAAYHYTGLYPDGWTGVRFPQPPRCAIGGETAQTTRDLIVNRLLGEPNARGTGLIPKHCIGEITYARGGLQNQVESFYVRHHGADGREDGWSKVHVFSYSKGWERIQGYTLDLISIDEEPVQFMVYDEFSARLNATQGYMRISMTPLKGMTQLYTLFKESHEAGSELRGLRYYDIRRATHWTEEHRKQIIEKYSNHPYAQARLMGLPVAGEGLVYAVPDSQIVVKDFVVPQGPGHYNIIGLDFPHTVGVFAAVRLYYDKQRDVVYLIDSHKEKGGTYVHNAHRVAMMGGKTIPVAWPHDGGRVTGDGTTVAGQYRDLGLNMNAQPAAMIDISGKRTNSLWGIIEEVYERMADGRFKVFESQREFLIEKSLYRVEDGKLAKELDDHLIDAMHKAMMDLRFASDRPGRQTVSDYSMPGSIGDLVGDYNFFNSRKGRRL